MISDNVNRRHEPYLKFKAYLVENKIGQQYIADLLEKTISAINQKINGTGGDFSVSEVRLICTDLKISSDEYFFNQKVS